MNLDLTSEMQRWGVVSVERGYRGASRHQDAKAEHRSPARREPRGAEGPVEKALPLTPQTKPTTAKDNAVFTRL